MFDDDVHQKPYALLQHFQRKLERGADYVRRCEELFGGTDAAFLLSFSKIAKPIGTKLNPTDKSKQAQRDVLVTTRLCGEDLRTPHYPDAIVWAMESASVVLAYARSHRHNVQARRVQIAELAVKVGEGERHCGISCPQAHEPFPRARRENPQKFGRG